MSYLIMNIKRTFSVLFIFFVFSSFADEYIPNTILRSMSLEEKIGQLFVAPACPLRKESHKKDLKELISEYHIGGIIMKASDPKSQVDFINEMQDFSSNPLFVTMNAEWGLGMIMMDTISFPKNLTLGAIIDNNMIYLLGAEIAKQCIFVGGNINLAPVVDVNTNPYNPIIHMRSFGENPQNVADKAVAFISGMQEHLIYACAKHYPGHGNTSVDSHEELPVVNSSKEILDSADLFTFKKSAEDNVGAIMIAHLVVPSLDPSKSPSSLSRRIVKEILRDKWNYQGLIITDALNMKALTLQNSVEDIAKGAFIAGNDLLLYGDHINENIDRIIESDIPKAFNAIKTAILRKELNEKDLDEKVLRILNHKIKLNLFHTKGIVPPVSNLMNSLNSDYAYRLKQDLYRQAITVIKNDDEILPIVKKNMKIAYIPVGNIANDSFLELIKKQADVTVTTLDDSNLNAYANVLIPIYNVDYKKPNYNLDLKSVDKVRKISRSNKTIICLFGTPYAAKYFDNPNGIVIAYEEDIDAQKAAFEVIFNLIRPKGKLPVTASELYKVGTSVTW